MNDLNGEWMFWVWYAFINLYDTCITLIWHVRFIVVISLEIENFKESGEVCGGHPLYNKDKY